MKIIFGFEPFVKLSSDGTGGIILFDCVRRVHTQELATRGYLWGEKKGMNHETNTLPKQLYPVRSAAGHSTYLDYLSPYQFSIKPKASFKLAGVDIDLWYSGSFSGNHAANAMYLDFRWMF